MPRLDVYNLGGGQNSQVTPLFIKNSECEIVQNYHMDRIGSLKKRNGIANLVGQIINNKSILGMFYFKDIQGTDRTNILVATNDASDTNSDIFALESNAWAISKTNDTASALPEFASFVDYVFRANGSEVVNTSNDPRPTGGSWGTTNAPTVIKPKYVKVWEDRVYVANDTNSSKGSRLFWSSLPAADGTITWTTGTDFADINPDDNDEITWIEPFGPRLLIFKNDALYRWTFGQVEPDKIIDVGTPQGRTVKQTHGVCFFANKLGVWAYQSGQPILISRKIQPFIDAIPTLDNMRAEVDNDHYYLYIGDVTVDGETFNNTMLVYTLSLETWHMETYPFEIKAMARFQTKTLGNTAIANAIYLGDDDGYVYRKDTGTQDVNGTTATPINGYIRTKEFPLDFPQTSILEKLYVVANQAAGAKVNYRIDRAEEFTPWHDLKARITENNLGGRAKTFQMTITDNSLIQSQIEGFSIQFKPESDRRKASESVKGRN